MIISQKLTEESLRIGMEICSVQHYYSNVQFSSSHLNAD